MRVKIGFLQRVELAKYSTGDNGSHVTYPDISIQRILYLNHSALYSNEDLSTYSVKKHTVFHPKTAK